MILRLPFTLSNGVAIPKLGLGTWRIENEAAANVARNAAEIGYRHFDIAQAYANEHGVGEGLRASGVGRNAMFVTTKLAAECKTYAHAKKRIDGSLRAIGVSNFERADLDNLFENGTVAPMVNQILAHVGNTRFDLIDYSRSKGMLVEAYSPVAHGAVLNNAKLATLPSKYAVGIPQLCIRYCLQLGLLPLPKTVSPEHMRSDAAVDFVISDADMAIFKDAGNGTDYGEASMFPVFGRKRQVDDARGAPSAHR